MMNPRHIENIARVISVTMLFALLAGVTPGTVIPAHAAPGDLTRVSVDSSGAQANGRSIREKLSADGRYVAFVSDAMNLVPNDTNNADDIFVKDRQTGAITRVSVRSNGAEANDGSASPAISGDGRFVAFYSDASNLVNGDTNGFADIFVHDRQTGQTTRVSVDSSGAEANAPPPDYYALVSISGDGRFVAYYSDASNLVSGDTNGVSDIFVYDRQNGRTTRASVASNGTEANGSSRYPNLSSDGHYVTFTSAATNLVSGDTNGKRDIFVYDLQTGNTTRVSVNTRGEEADGGSTEPAISGDGRYVVFLSASSNLDPRADEYSSDELVYVHDCQTGQTILASVDSGGRILTVGLFLQPTISNNGRYVAFSFYDKGDNNGIMNIWVRDLQTGISISVNYGNDSSFGSSLSADGKVVAFWSGASNLVSGDTNGASDIFVREIAYDPERNPTVASITPDCGFSKPVCTYPSHASVSFIVLFSEPVTGVTADDFSLDMLEGITGASITGVTGYGVEYFVTVDTGTGDGRLRLNLVDNDSIMDTALNPLGGVGMGNGNFTGKPYRIDKSNPTVTSIVRTDPDPTTAETVRFTVTFSEIVYPVRSSDFVFSTTGNISGATITDISPSGESATFTITVSTGTGDGTLRMDLIDGDSILDYKNNPLGGVGTGNGDFTTGETYIINKSMPPSPPAVISSLRADANPTNAASVNFTVNFSEPVSGVDSGDFSLTTTGSISGALVSNVSGSGNTYTVSVSTGSGSGDLRLDVINDDSIRNAFGSSLGGPFTWGEAYTINKADNTAPAVISILRADVNSADAEIVNFTVTFSEAVSGVDAGDFMISTTGNISDTIINDLGGSANIYTVSVVTGSGSGTLRLDLIDNDSILNFASQPLGGVGVGNGNFTTGEEYTIIKNPPPPVDNSLTRVSVDSSGVQANGPSQNSQLSGDGRYVVFESFATNLVADDTNNVEDIFVKDLQTGATTRVSLASLTGEQANGDSRGAAISSDGLYVAFESAATNLVSVDTNGQNDVFVRDRQTGITTLVSVDSAGVQTNGISRNYRIPISISGDGRFTVFISQATNLVSGDMNAAQDVFVHDLQTGATTLVSVNSLGVQADGPSYSPTISVNGRYVVFASPATNLVDGDTNEVHDVFVRDLQTGQTTRVSVNSDGVQADMGAGTPSISGDGRYVSFSSSAHNLMSVDTQEFGYIYVHDRQSGTTTVASFDNGDPMYGWTDGEVISANGRYIAFTFDDKGDGEAVTWNYVHDRLSDQNVLPIYEGDRGAPYRLSLSADGLYFSFDSDASLVPDDTNGVRDVFVKKMTYPPDLSPTVSGTDPTCGGGYDCVYPTEASVTFNVHFSESVTGVTADDFSLTMTGGVSGASVTGVRSSTRNYKDYFVTVNTGAGDGKLWLNVIDDDSIQDVALNPLGGVGAGNGNYDTGAFYEIDRNPPVITGISRTDPNPTSADSVHFTVTFSESVSARDVDANDFSLATTGNISGATVTRVDGTDNNNIYNVTVNTGTGDGTLRLDVPASATITDSVGFPLAGLPYSSGEVYTIERNAPAVISILRTDPNPTTANSVHFNVTFSEVVSGVDASDFMLTTTDKLSGASITGLSGSANTYTITAATGSGNGTLRLDLIDNDSILDSINQPLGGLGAGNGNFTTGEVYTINKFSPTILSTSYHSTGSSDGWVLESTEDSNLGGSKNSTASTFILGDDARDRQFRTILHFPTYYLPDNAVVTQAILMIKKQSVVGTDPFTTHQNISVDIRNGLFDNYSLFKLGSLQPQDFQVPADMYAVGTIQNNPVNDWYWTILVSKAFPSISLTGVTQLRLAFQLDDNDDQGDDYIRFYSGDYDAQKDRPHLLIEYYVPSK